MKKINENTKVTLTLKQLKKLVKESMDSDFVIKKGILVEYNGDYGDVVIPDGVTKIGTSVFERCSELKSITIPDSVTEIGKDAFRGCSGLKSVTIPGSVKNIKDSAFYDCENLKSVTIEEGVTNIEQFAFAATNLTSITIPNSVTKLGEQSFAYCHKLTSATIPGDVVYVGFRVFNVCKNLKTINCSNPTVKAKLLGQMKSDKDDDNEPPPCTAVINGKTRTFTNFDRFLKVLSKHLKPGIDKEDWLWWDMADFIDQVPGNEDKYFDGSVTKVTTPSIDEVMGLG